MDNKNINELVEDIKIVDERLKYLEKKELIMNYKKLLMEKEYLLCQYTCLTYKTDNNETILPKKENKR